MIHNVMDNVVEQFVLQAAPAARDSSGTDIAELCTYTDTRLESAVVIWEFFI